ncbi:hypothetical protein MTR_7g078930 [Medicago truncatula]|uniref:Uncharacterized protein n=1 Tax=Medicago truncatula TaxID=3880 RepID=G7L6N1_MEDTR|nr:hypothetical protein MTR_7g078930 [Medicago truncatula]
MANSSETQSNFASVSVLMFLLKSINHTGGIRRARRNQLRIRGDVTPCWHTRPDVKALLQVDSNEKQRRAQGVEEQGGISLLCYIYNHTSSLNLMRKKTINVELVRHGVTRFATTFLMLQRLPKLKSKLR